MKYKMLISKSINNSHNPVNQSINTVICLMTENNSFRYIFTSCSLAIIKIHKFFFVLIDINLKFVQTNTYVYKATATIQKAI